MGAVMTFHPEPLSYPSPYDILHYRRKMGPYGIISIRYPIERMSSSPELAVFLYLCRSVFHIFFLISLSPPIITRLRGNSFFVILTMFW